MPSFTVRTSDSDPIYVDEVPLFGRPGLPERPGDAGLPGRLGLTMAPGKRCVREIGDGIWKRDFDQDLAVLRGTYGTELLLSLMRDEEYEALRIADLVPRAEAHGIEVRRFTIRDMSTPDDPAAFGALIEDAHAALAGGRTVTVHCRAGLGRSGLVAACILVRAGMEPVAAIDHVRAHRDHAIETLPQEAYVATYAAWWNGGE